MARQTRSQHTLASETFDMKRTPRLSQATFGVTMSRDSRPRLISTHVHLQWRAGHCPSMYPHIDQISGATLESSTLEPKCENCNRYVKSRTTRFTHTFYRPLPRHPPGERSPTVFGLDREEDHRMTNRCNETLQRSMFQCMYASN